MKFAKYLIPAALICAMSVAGFAQDVKTDFDHHTDFSQLHTYYWAKVQTENPLWQQRIQDAVDKDLQSKGWQRVDNGGDVAVTAVGATQNQQEYQTFYNNMGPGWWWGGFGTTAQTTVENYKIGTLVIDMYNAHNKRLIWRGTATDTLSDKPEKNENKLDKAVNKMFEHFPPQGAKVG
jgi:hypothetical protein